MAKFELEGIEFVIDNMQDWLNLICTNKIRNLKEYTLGYSSGRYEDEIIITRLEGFKEERRIKTNERDPEMKVVVWPESLHGSGRYSSPFVTAPTEITLKKYYELEDMCHEEELNDLNSFYKEKKRFEKKYSKGKIKFGAMVDHNKKEQPVDLSDALEKTDLRPLNKVIAEQQRPESLASKGGEQVYGP